MRIVDALFVEKDNRDNKIIDYSILIDTGDVIFRETSRLVTDSKDKYDIHDQVLAVRLRLLKSMAEKNDVNLISPDDILKELTKP